MLKRLRIALLLYVLLFVAAAEYLTARHSTSWEVPLWVDVYAVRGDASEQVTREAAELTAEDLHEIEAFFAAEAERFGLPLERPIRIGAVNAYSGTLPPLLDRPSALDTIAWSLKMRWIAARLRWAADGPSGDVALFAVFHEPEDGVPLDRSTALAKGLIAIAHVFAGDGMARTNQIVMAHELLHTLGATDKYDLVSNDPLYPAGYADRHAKPLLPQRDAELMAGRIAIAEGMAVIPNSLARVLIGPETAREIGWLAD